MRIAWLAAGGVCLLGALGCEELTPTSVEDQEGVLPAPPATVEVRLGWDDFASGLEVLGGFGSPADLGGGIVARAFAGSLNSRTLSRFQAFPEQTVVVDSTGRSVVDLDLTFVGGRVVVVLDRDDSTNEGAVTFALGALGQPWDVRTASWTHAVDTAGRKVPWEEPGGGPVAPLGTMEWLPAETDSILFPVDSAQVAAWADTTDASRGIRLDLLTEGERVQVVDVRLRLETRSSINPDTALVLTAPPRDLTFVFEPTPEPPPDGLRVGGAPSWRSVMDVTVPDRLSGPEALCAAVGCPVALTPERVNYGAVVLTTRRTEPAFQPTDSVVVDVRPVFLRDALPKSPLGPSLTPLGFGIAFAPEAFGDADGVRVEVPITQLVQDLLRGRTATGGRVVNTLALLSVFEPFSFPFATFYGPGSPLEPQLKLIVTAGPPVGLR